VIQLADMTAEEVHYEHRTTVPGSYRTGVRESYPNESPYIDEQHDPDVFVVIRGGSQVERTAIGAKWASLSSEDWRYWTEADYVDNQKTLQHYKVMAEKLPGSQDVVDQYHKYERDLLRLESYPNVFFDGIGDTGYWPNEVRPLMSCLQERMRTKVPTVVAIASEAVEKIPEWDRILLSKLSVVIDLEA
jgi:hypothetical protein